MSGDLSRYMEKLESNLVEFGIAAEASSDTEQWAARYLVDRLAIAIQASVLLRFGDQKVSCYL